MRKRAEKGFKRQPFSAFFLICQKVFAENLLANKELISENVRRARVPVTKMVTKEIILFQMLIAFDMKVPAPVQIRLSKRSLSGPCGEIVEYGF